MEIEETIDEIVVKRLKILLVEALVIIEGLEGQQDMPDVKVAVVINTWKNQVADFDI